jgi:spore coat polysaccharide biosynthesis protein SpsF (cytidylyltransferase family)
MRSQPNVQMHNISQEVNHENLRLTLDTKDDIIVLKNMMEKTDSINDVYQKIEQHLLQHPEWISLNAQVEQKNHSQGN